MSDKDQKTINPQRRQFLRHTGAGVLAVGASQALGAAAEISAKGKNRIPGNDYDVVVIGGGFGGAAAARDSQENGYRTLLLEARNRLGGRTFSTVFEGHKVEVGGMWIHWTQPFVWAEKERYGLEVKQTPGATPDQMILRIDGKSFSATEEQVVEIMAGAEQLTMEARTVCEQPYDSQANWDLLKQYDGMTVAQGLKNKKFSELQRAVLTALACAPAMLKPEEAPYLAFLQWWMLSGNSMLAFNDATMRYKLKHGTISLLQAMLDDAKPKVQLSTPVKAVEDLGDHVRITTARGQTITAASVIVATPLNVIDNIKFTPALPAAMTQAAQEKHAASNSYKVLIKVKGKVGNLFTLAEAGHALTTVFTYEEAEDHTLLVGFGDRDLIDVYDDEALQTALRDFIPGVEVESSYSYEWALDPYSKGIHCVYKPDWHKKYHRDFQQDNGRIIIGVGDYVEGWRGFIDGAISGGIKAAVRVQKLLG